MSGDAKTIADLIAARFGVAGEDGAGMPASGEIAALLRHRSQRRFRPEKVPEELQRVALAAALSAPSKSDLQQCAIIVVEDTALRAELNRLIDMQWVHDAPHLLVFCADGRRLPRLSEARGKPFANDHMDALLNCAVDAGIVLATFVRAAEALGLGCCPISVIRNHIEEASSALGLPERVFPVAGMGFGWPREAGEVSLRLPMSVSVHRDRYDDSALLAEVDAYDRRRAERQPIADDSQRAVERFGRASFYGWSEDKARQYARPQRTQLAAFLRARGFRLE